jgi:hypothetical protein
MGCVVLGLGCLWVGLASLREAAEVSCVDGHAGGAAHEVDEQVDAVLGGGGLDLGDEVGQRAREDLDPVAGGELGGGEFDAGDEAEAEGCHEVWGDHGGLGAQRDDFGDAARGVDGADAARGGTGLDEDVAGEGGGLARDELLAAALGPRLRGREDGDGLAREVAERQGEAIGAQLCEVPWRVGVVLGHAARSAGLRWGAQLGLILRLMASGRGWQLLGRDWVGPGGVGGLGTRWSEVGGYLSWRMGAIGGRGGSGASKGGREFNLW